MRLFASSGCPIRTMGAPVCELNSPSMAAMAAGWCLAMYVPCRSPVGKIWVTQEMTPAITPTRRKILPCSANRFSRT